MIIARSSEARSFMIPAPHERELKVLLSPALQEGVEGLAIGMTILPPGQSSSYHSHEAEEETWVVLTGEGEVVVDGERAAVGPETVIYLPPGAQHQIVNNGEVPIRMLWIYTPPGAERVILDGKFA